MSEARIVFSAQDKTRAAFDAVRGGLQGITDKASLAAGTLAGLGSAVTIGGMVALARSVADSLDAFNDLADATGASVENISGLEAVARRNGTAFEVVGTALTKFNAVLTESRKEGSEAANVLKAMGLNAKALRDLDPAEAMRQAAVALSQFADDGNKARAVQELFGKSIKEVAPLLKDLSEAGRLNATVTSQQAQEAERFNKQLAAMAFEASQLKREILSGLLPALNSLLQNFRDIKGQGNLDLAFRDAARDFLTGGARITGDHGGDLARLARERAQIQRQRSFAERSGLPTREMDSDLALLGRYQQFIETRQLNGVLAGMTGVDTSDALSRRMKPAASLNYRTSEEVKAAKASADTQIKEAMRVAQERQRLRIAEDKSITEFFQSQDEQALKSAAAQRELAARNSFEYLQALDKEIIAVNEAARAAEWQESVYGLSAEQLHRLTMARIEDERQQRLSEATTIREIEAANAVYEARARLAGTELRRANREAAQAASSEWAQVSQSFTDQLMAGGKNVAQYLKDLFRTLVLRPIISPIGTAMATALGGFPTAANAAGSGILGNLGTLTGLAGMSSAFGGGVGAGFSALFGEAGLMGALDAGSIAIGAGHIAGGLGTFAGALGPLALGAMAIYSLAQKFKGETRGGGQYNFGNLIAGPSGGELAQGGAAAAATADSINALLSAIGSSSRLSNFMSGLETSDKGKGFAYAGGTLTTGGAFGQGWGAGFAVDGYMNRRGNFTADQAVAAFGEELKQATLQALQAATDVPLAIVELVKGKDFDSMATEQLDAVLSQINAVISSVDQFRAAVALLPFENLRDLSFDAATAMGKAVGGLERLSAGANDFFTNYYSEEEQRRQAAVNIRNVLAGAGADFSVDQILGSSRAQFRQITEYYATRTDEPGQKLYATLLAVSGAFAAIHPQAATLADALNSGADSMSAYSDSLRDQAELLGDNIDTMQAFASSLRRFRGELTMGALAQLSPEARYNAARGEFQRLAALSPTDPERLGGLEEAGRAFLEASQTYNASSMAYFVDLAAVRGAVEASESAALSNAQISQMQLNVLNQQLTALQGIQANTAPGATAPAPAGGAAWGGSTTTSGGASFGGSPTAIASTSWASLLAGIDWSDGAAGTAQLAGYMRSYGKGIADVQSVYNWFTTQQLADHMKQYGYADMVPGYAGGGTAQGYAWVGERGRELAFFPQPTRIYSAAESQQMATGGVGSGGALNELRQLRQEVASNASELQALRLLLASYAQRDLDNGAAVAAGLQETRRALRDQPPQVRRALPV